MILAGAFMSAAITQAATPEPLDTAFLDYLASVEGKDENWTVVADEKVRKKMPARDPAKPQPPKPPAEEVEKKP